MRHRLVRNVLENFGAALIVCLTIWASSLSAPPLAPTLTAEGAAEALALVPRLVAAHAACDHAALCLRI